MLLVCCLASSQGLELGDILWSSRSVRVQCASCVFGWMAFRRDGTRVLHAVNQSPEPPLT
jgi:hypothetical protein